MVTSEICLKVSDGQRNSEKRPQRNRWYPAHSLNKGDIAEYGGMVVRDGWEDARAMQENDVGKCMESLTIKPPKR